MFAITVSEKGRPERTAVFDKGTITVGRGPDNDLILHGESVSMMHAVFDSRDGLVVVRDLMSRNGTYVNGRRVEEAKVDATDAIGIGDVLIRCGSRAADRSRRASPGSTNHPEHRFSDRERDLILPIQPDPRDISRSSVDSWTAGVSVTVSEPSCPVRVETFSVCRIVIGRMPGNDLVLPKANVSKQHAQIETVSGVLVLTDLKSTNGTYVNGRRLEGPTVVGVRDRIVVGDYVLALSDARDATAARREQTAGENRALQVEEQSDAARRSDFGPAPPAIAARRASRDSPVHTRFELRVVGEHPRSLRLRDAVATITIGAATDQDVVLVHPRASTHHATIRMRGDSLVAYDLDSVNGTFVNGVRVALREPHVLKDNDVVSFGESTPFVVDHIRVCGVPSPTVAEGSAEQEDKAATSDHVASLLGVERELTSALRGHARRVERYLELALRDLASPDEYGDRDWRRLRPNIRKCLHKIADNLGYETQERGAERRRWLKSMQAVAFERA